MPAVVNLTYPSKKARGGVLRAHGGIVECTFCAAETIDFVPTSRGMACHKCVRAFVACVFEQIEKDLKARRTGELERKRA
jgi:hypothetical protein